MMNTLEQFLNNIHPSTTVISHGYATVMDNTAPAVELKNLYGQHIVWGMFSVSRGKFKGALANNANTEDVVYINHV